MKLDGKIIELWNAGYSSGEIAEMTGRARGGVTNALWRAYERGDVRLKRPRGGERGPRKDRHLAFASDANEALVDLIAGLIAQSTEEGDCSWSDHSLIRLREAVRQLVVSAPNIAVAA